MTTSNRLERELPTILEDIYLGWTPDYRDEVLATAFRNTQRAAWTFPGRWIPMLDVAVRPVAMPRLPLHALGVALLVIALLFAAVVAGPGSRLPRPFGIARNGLITWAFEGDIWTGDPVDGTVRNVVATDDLDRNPVFSRDGTHIAFLRQIPDRPGYFDLVVTQPDGSSPTTLTPVPMPTPDRVEWTPDGGSLLVNLPTGELTRYFLDRTPPRPLLQGVHIEPDPFLPPDGGQMLYEREDDQRALWIMNVDGTDPHELFGGTTAACTCAFTGPARWSPDGRMIAFPANTDGLQTRMLVMNADGTNQHQLDAVDGVWSENDPVWSPDGTRVAFDRWERSDTGDWIVKPIAVVDVATGALTPLGVAPPDAGALIEWAPDGRSILSLPATVVNTFSWGPTLDGSVARPTLFDLPDGSPRQLDWSVGSTASWQRR
jgi:hypothetical protein